MVCALWLGFTLAKNKEREKKKSKDYRRSFGVQIIFATGQEASLSGMPQAVTQGACTSHLEIREDHRVLPVQI